MSWRGVFSGVLALVALEAIVRTNASATRFGAMFTALGSAAEWFMSPSVPGIPDIAGRGTPDPLSHLNGGGTAGGKGSGGGGKASGGGGGGAGGGWSW